MLKILLHGCSGKMGKVITEVVKESSKYEIVAGVGRKKQENGDYPVYEDIRDVKENVEVIVDFSVAVAVPCVVDFAVDRNIPVVIATTGIGESTIEKIEQASRKVPIFLSSNTSIGINIINNLLKDIVPMLVESNFDIEIIEKHHNEKVDAPSGTALLLANTINESLNSEYEYIYDRHNNRNKRERNEIGIHTIRGGTIAGEHSIIFAGNDEIIEIKHTALSKKIFAIGALKIAEFMLNKNPGWYNMNDVINSK